MEMEQLRMQESTMECSEEEEEEEVGEPDKNEWEDRTQMDCEPQDFAQEPALHPFESSVSEKSCEDLDELIEAREREKQALEKNLQVQVENIVELQNSCERTLFTVDQIPTLRELQSQRCHEVLKEIQNLKNKQTQLNALIDYTVQKYDEDLQMVYSLKEEFQAHKHLNYERITVFEADLLDLIKTGRAFAVAIDKRIVEKRGFYKELVDHLVQLEKDAKAVDALNAQVESTFQNANSLNAVLFENESQLENLKRNSEEVRCQIHQENSKFSLKMEDYKRKELEASVDLNILLGKIEKARLDLDRLLADNVESKTRLASLRNQLTESDNDRQLKAAAKLALTFQLTELHDQQSTLSQTMSGLTRCKNLIAAGENDIISLEAELERLTSRSVDLETKRAEIDQQIVSYERYVQEAEERTEYLEEEFKKMEQELPNLRASYQKETNEIANDEMKTEAELSQLEAAYNEMVDSYSKMASDLESCESKLSQLRRLNETLNDSIGEKRSTASENELAIKSITEDMDNCSAEWNALSEQERTGLQVVNTVKQLNNELAQSKAQLSQMTEAMNQMLVDMNDENSKKIEEKVRETESKKRQYVKSLEELSKEGAKIEDDYKSLRSKTTVFSSLLKEAREQAELFSCEKSLFRTFAEWVFKSDAVEPSEEWVTSTSDARFFGDSQPVEMSEEAFNVKTVKTSYK